MNKIFLSIIIPTFNEEKYLPRLLRDISKQPQKELEVIVVDGGSSDKTITKAQQFITKLPLKIFVTSLKNVSAQRNFGAMHAQGKYLQFFDADVQLHHKYFVTFKNALTKKNPDFATSYVKADSKNIYDQMITIAINIGADISAFIDQDFAGGWNFIVKRNIFYKTKGFREDIVHGEDTEYSLRLNKLEHPMYVIKKPIVTYSLRRYREEGRVKSISKHLQAGIYMLFNGPITKDIFEYPMGGGWYSLPKDKKQKSDFAKKAKIFIKKLEKLIEE